MTEPESTPPPSPADSHGGARRLTTLYVAALSTVALLTIGAQLLVQRQLQTGESDSRVINVAGRQRMLSQRLAKSALLATEQTGETQAAATRELAVTLEDWSAHHDGLLHGDDSLGLPGGPSDRVAGLFADIRPHFEAMQSSARRLIDRESGGVAVETILSHEAAFLDGMDLIVSQLVAEAEERVSRLRWLESFLLALTLTVLFVEGLFIFRPAVGRIEQTLVSLRRVGQELRAAKDEAEAANEAKSRFLAHVSHELRTPMTAVLGMTELAKEAPDEATRTRYLTIVEEAGESLLRLLNDLIDTARVDANEMAIAAAPFRPAETTEKVVRLLGPLAEKKGLALRSRLGIDPALTVRGDEQRLVQVLVNLVGNAIKWTDAGSVTVGCESPAPATDAYQLTWSVADTGVGITQADQARVFEPFAQVESGSGARRGGAGLGLAISLRIVEAMGGSMRLSSEPGMGTTIEARVTLPAASAAPATGGDERQEPPPPGGRLRVLVVEDTEVTQLLLREVLQNAGHAVTSALDGPTAIRHHADADYDLVVTDLQLGEMDGVAVAARLRQTAEAAGRRTPPILCLTADATFRQADNPVFDAVLTKPFRRDQLLGQVAALTTAASATKPVARGAFGFDEEFLGKLAEVLRDAVPAQLRELRDAHSGGDHAAVQTLAHRMRGQLSYFDGHGLERPLAQLEIAAGSGDEQGVNGLMAKIVPEMRRFLTSLA